MNAEVFQIMILAAIPLLIVEIFIGVDYFGVTVDLMRSLQQ